MKWQLIETAPKDGRTVLIATRSHSDGFVLARWCDHVDYPAFMDESGDLYRDASQWAQVLPPE